MIGKILCEYWGLPENITDAIYNHHEPLLAQKSDQIHSRLVNIGDYICRKAEIGDPGDEVVLRPSNAVLYTLGSDPGKIDKVLDDVYQEFLELKDDIEGAYSHNSN